MGYCIYQIDSKFLLRDPDAALQAVKDATVREFARAGGGSSRHAEDATAARELIDQEPEWKRPFCSVQRLGDLYPEGSGFQPENPDELRVRVPWYSWVDDSEVLNADNFVEAMRAWRWEAEVSDGHCHGLEWEGEKYSDDMVVPLEAIAPFVEDGSFLEMRGEDDEMWRWVFRGGQLHTYNAQIQVIWPEGAET